MTEEQNESFEISTEDIAEIAKRFFGKELTNQEAVVIFDRIDIDLVLDIAMDESDSHRRKKVAYAEIENQIKENNLL